MSKRRMSSVFGWLLFLLLIFGSRLAPPVANWLSQVTGFNVSPAGLIGAAIGLYIVGSILVTLGRGAARLGRSNETPTPSIPPASPTSPGGQNAYSLPKPSDPPRQISRPAQPSVKLPTSTTQHPGAPQMEPIIDPRIVLIGVAGLLFIGGVFAVVFFLLVP
jgi:hypothetical protein